MMSKTSLRIASPVSPFLPPSTTPRIGCCIWSSCMLPGRSTPSRLRERAGHGRLRRDRTAQSIRLTGRAPRVDRHRFRRYLRPPSRGRRMPLAGMGEYPHTLTYPEVIAAIALPIIGVGVAIWRFGRGDIGPGFANLLLAAASTVAWAVLLVAA